MADTESTAAAMRRYWDEKAQINAAWYVDTSLQFDAPDMQRFFETGRVVARHVLDRAPVLPSRRGLAVEIGSGLGRICLALAGEFERVVGYDISPEMTRRAAELVDDPRVEFRVTDGTGLPGLPDGSTDLVVSFTVFQHMPSVALIERYVLEAGRVLAPGGVFAFQWDNRPDTARARWQRALAVTLQRTGLRRERHDRNAAQFLGSRVPLDVIEAALQRGGMVLRGTDSLGELFAWAWAERVEPTPRSAG